MMCKRRSPPSHGAVPSLGAEIGQRLEGVEVWKSFEAGKEAETGGLEARQAPSSTNQCPGGDLHPARMRDDERDPCSHPGA